MSNRTELHDKIQQITAKIIDLNTQFAQAERLNQLDIDLLRRYTVDLYDATHELKAGINTPPIVATPPIPKVQPVAPEVKKEVPPTIVANEPKIVSTPLPPKQEIPKPQPELIPQPTPITEVKETPVIAPPIIEAPVIETPKVEVPAMETPKVEEVKAPVIEERKVEIPVPVVEEKKIEEPIATPPPIAPITPPPIAKPIATAPKVEIEESKESSLNERLHKPEGSDLASKLQQTPIHDLKKAISINKKFEFINQLFDGDHESYTKSVHYINGLNNGHDATMFFNNLKREYAWDEENKLFLEFSDLVRRRFM
jgi:hypothetical protein